MKFRYYAVGEDGDVCGTDSLEVAVELATAMFVVIDSEEGKTVESEEEEEFITDIPEASEGNMDKGE